MPVSEIAAAEEEEGEEEPMCPPRKNGVYGFDNVKITGDNPEKRLSW